MVRFIANGLFHWSIQCAIVPITENCYAWNQTRANVLLLLCTAYNINANRIGSVFSDFQLCRCFIHTLRKMKENTKVLQIQERIPNEKKKYQAKHKQNSSVQLKLLCAANDFNARLLFSPNLIPSLIIKQCLLFSFCEYGSPTRVRHC